MESEGNLAAAGSPVQRSRSFDYFDVEIDTFETEDDSMPMEPLPRSASAEEMLKDEEEAIKAVRSVVSACS